MKFVDLFCGGGFGARGAVRAGGKPILAVDAWDVATQTYEANFPEAKVICDYIENVNPFDYADDYKPDVLLTSPECTSHSIARGAKPGSEKSRETAIGIIPWLEAMDPNWLIVENVRRMKKWDRHNELVETIEDYGYAVSDLHLNAADFGTAQSRKRMFLVCHKGGERFTESDIISGFGKHYKSADSIIDRSEKYKSTPLHNGKRAAATLERAQRAIDELGEGKDFIIVYYSSDYAGGWQTLDAPLRTITTVDRFGLVTWKGDVPYLRMLQPSELIKAMGGAHRPGINGHPSHQLPYGNRREKVKLCGNGVCSTVIEAIFNQIKHIERMKGKKAA